MQFTHFMDKYPVYSLDFAKSSSRFSHVDEILAVLEQRVENSPLAQKIAVFDHYAHTTSLPEGEVADNIRAAKHLVFCFGVKLPNPQAMALRPRSIGICELDDRFVVTFMEVPNPQLNEMIKGWVTALANNE